MNVFKLLTIATTLACTATLFQQPSNASECGLSCCIAAGMDGVGSNNGLNISLQYDTMIMKTNKTGTSTITPTQIINDKLANAATGMYAVSTKMVMQKIAANVSYRIDQDNALLLTIPYIINDMDMKMGMKMMGNINYTDMTMDTIQGIGDVSLLYIHDLYKDSEFRTRKRFSIGVGIKAPTGASDARNKKGDLVHMMMQAGTNTWDALFTANGVLAFGEHDDGGAQWIVSPSLFYQANTRNDLGYKVGNRLNYDISTRYRLTSKFNVKLDINGIKSEQDSTDGTIDTASGKVAYQNVNGNVLDNVANTGLHSIFLSPGFQWVLDHGYHVSGEYRVPVYQDVNGIQQVTDNWYFLRVSKSF